MRITTVLLARGPAAAIVLTDAQREALCGVRKAVPVRVTIGDSTLALRLARMGGENLIGFSKASRVAAGVEAGDEVDAEIVVDDGPRPIEIPPALASTLDAEGLRSGWDALSPSRRKELARGVVEAKKDDTRARRVAAAVDAARARLDG